MPNRFRWFAVAMLPFVFVTMAGCAPGRVSPRADQVVDSLPSDKPITLSLPNRDWSLEVPAKGFLIMENVSGETLRYVLMYLRGLQLTMSIYLGEEPSEGRKEFCRDKYLPRRKKFFQEHKEEISDERIYELGQMSVVELLIKGVLPDMDVEVLYGYYAKGNTCLDIHIEKPKFRESDYPLMRAVLNGVKITSDVPPPPTAPDDMPSVRSYEILSQVILQLAVPKSWQTSIRQPLGVLLTPADIPTITALPPTGRDFKLLLSVFPPVKGRPRRSLQETRAFLEEEGKKYLTKAVEENLVFEEVQGRDGAGYFFTLTDKDSTLPDTNRPDEYKYWTTGRLGVGNWDLQFSMLFNKQDAPEWHTALDMLKSASLRQ